MAHIFVWIFLSIDARHDVVLAIILYAGIRSTPIFRSIMVYIYPFYRAIFSFCTFTRGISRETKLSHMYDAVTDMWVLLTRYVCIFLGFMFCIFLLFCSMIRDSGTPGLY